MDVIDEGFGARIENSLRILDKMNAKLDESIEFLEDNYDLVENDQLPDRVDHVISLRLINAAEKEDYDLIVRILKSLYKKQKRRRSFK